MQRGLRMNDDAEITIYQFSDPSKIPGLEKHIDQLRSVTGITTSTYHESAYLGQLAGDAFQIVLSDPVQGIKNIVEIGLILWGIVGTLKAAGKKLRIGKKLVPPLLVSEAQRSSNENDSISLDGCGEPVFWGPMIVTNPEGFAKKLLDDYVEECSPEGYFMAIVMAKPNGRAQTRWYLLSADASICASWKTQTLDTKLPDFLRPKRNKNNRPESD